MNERRPNQKGPKARNILVTGGGGFLGKAIIGQLLEKGHNVTSFSRKVHPLLDAMGANQISGDITQAEAICRAAQNRDVVFHVAAKAGVWGPFDTYYRTNVTGTRNVLAACRSNQVPVLVHTSSPSVVFDGGDMNGLDESVPYPAHYHSPYPQTKAMAEKEVIAAAKTGLRTIVLRPHLIWGPEDPHLVPRIIDRAKKLRRIGKSANIVDTIFIDNAAHAHVLAMEALEKNPKISGNVYFISDDDPIGLWTMIDRILAAAGKPPVTGSIHPKVAFWVGIFLELLYRTFGIVGEPMMTRFVARELATSHWFNISAAKRDLGYTATITIENGLERLKMWLMENGIQQR